MEAGVAQALGIRLGQRLFSISMQPGPLAWVAGPVAGMLIFGGMAWLGSRPLLSRPSAGILR